MFKKSLLSLMVLCFAFFGVARAQSELTVYEGTATSNLVPAYIFYFDDFTRSQFIIPAEDLTQMNGCAISALKFYTTSNNVPYTAVSSAKVYLMEVDYTTISALEPIGSGEVVFEGYFDIVSEGEGGSLTIEFETPYTYDGGNLLVGIENTEDVGYKNIYFYGTAVTGASWGGSSSTSLENVTGNQGNFIPQTTFTYIPIGDQTCDRPENFAVENITAHSASLTWDPIANAGFNLEIKGGEYDDWFRWGTNMGTNCTLNGLTHNTTYQARVQTVCDFDNGVVSGWRTISFTTENACPDPTDLTVSLTPGDGTVAELTWIENGTAEIWQICINEDEDNLIEVYGSESTPGQTLTFQFSDLTPDMTYTAKVRASCGDIDQSGWSNTVTFTPTDDYVVTVNDGTNTNGFVPIYGYWCDNTTKSQFIIPADDLQDMAYGTINRMTFYGTMTGNHPDWGSATFEVYMTETSETTLSELVDYNDMQKVMNSASLSIVNGQMVVVFDSPFEYMGDNLMVGFLQTASGQFSSCSWTGVTSEGASMGGYGTNISQQNFLPKTTFGYTPGETPDCPKPLYLAVNYTGGTTAEVSWTSNATSWDLQILTEAGAAANIIENVTDNPYTLTDLNLGTTYGVAVKANCGDAFSDWTNTVSFTTEACMPEDKCAITIELTDAYGDGGGQIQVVDALTNEVLGTFTNSSNSSTYTLAVCEGREINFVYTPTDSWPYENGWVITDINEVVISEHVGCSSSSSCDAPNSGLIATYTVNCIVTDCRTPSDLAISEVGPRSAKLSWTENGQATEWTVEVTLLNTPAPVEPMMWSTTSNPFEITGLQPESTYSVRVLPLCDVELWSNDIVFTTLVPCPTPNGIHVTDLTSTSATINWTGFTEAYDLRYAVVPTGRGVYSNNTQKVVEPLRHVNTNLYLTTNKAAQIGPKVTKEVTAVAPDREGNYLQYCTESFSGGVGTGAGSGTVYWAIRFPAADVAAYAGQNLTQVGVFLDVDGDYGWTYSGDYTASVYLGGEDAPGTLVTSATDTLPGDYAWHDIVLPEPVAIDGTQDLWLVFSATGIAYPMSGCDNVGNANSDFISLDGTSWEHAADYDLNYTWMIRGLVESNIDPSELDWVEIFGINANSCPIAPLTPSTNYIVQVRAACGDDGESAWITTYFVTHGVCDRPFNLTVEDISCNSAKLNWTGEQNFYNVRYRKAEYFEETTPWFSEDFEEGIPDTWTNLYREGDSIGWFALSEVSDYFPNGNYSSLSEFAHSGSNAATSASYVNYYGGRNVSNWLITPQLELQGVLRFYVTSEYADMDHYEVLLSTGGTDTTEFTTILKEMEGASYGIWDEVMIDLREYEGQQGYIAIHHLDYDKYFIVVDDFNIYPSTAMHDASEWVTLSRVTSPLLINDLELNSLYEWQVQGLNRSCNNSEGQNGVTEWSAIHSFVSSNGFDFIADGNWNDAANWCIGEVPEDYSDVTIAANAIIPADFDARVNNITFTEDGSLTIQDGGQLHSNVNVEATLEKNISGYGEGQGKWNLIASPVLDDIMPDSTSLTSGEYDLYEFWTNYTDNEWVNYKDEEDGGFSLSMGFGYLCAKAQGSTLSFTGTLLREYTNYLYDGMMLNFGDTTNTNGNWNLKGNLSPYNVYAYVGTIVNGNVELAEEQHFYKLNEEGTDLVASDNLVKPGESIFVRATGEGQYVFFRSHELNTDAKGGLNIAVTKINDSNTVSLPSTDKEKSLVNKQRKTNNATIDLKALKKTFKVKDKKACNKEVRNEWPIKLTAKKIR